MKTPRWLKQHIPLWVIFFTVLLVALILATRPKVTAEKIVERSWPVEVVEVFPDSLSPQLILLGRVESPRASTLSAAITAFIDATPVQEGDRVAAGSLLIEFDKEEIALQLQQRRADVMEMEALIASEMRRDEIAKQTLMHDEALLGLRRRAVEREEQIVAKQLGSEAALDEAKQAQQQQEVAVERSRLEVQDHPNRLMQLEAGLARAEALRDQAALDLSRTDVFAPFAGRVAQVDVAVGERIQMGASLISLYDTEHIEVRAQIPSRYLARAEARLDAGDVITAKAIVDDREVILRLARVSGQVAFGTGGVDGLFTVEQGGSALALGRSIFMTVDLAPEENVVALPASALYGKDVIYKQVDGRMQAVVVEYIGERRTAMNEREVLVRSETLVPGDIVVTSHLVNAIDGLKIHASD